MRAPLLLAVLTAACISTRPAWIDLPPPEVRAGVTVTVERTVRAPFGFTGFEGTVSNETGRTLRACELTIRVCDHEMQPIGRALATIEELGPRESRSYEARLVRRLKTLRTVLPPEVRLEWDPAPAPGP